MLSFARLLLSSPLAVLAAMAPLSLSEPTEPVPASLLPEPPQVYVASDCMTCHREEKARGLNHPLGVSGGSSLRPMDCLTCHSKESTSPAHANRMKLGKDPLLTTNRQELCLQCHKRETLSSGDVLSHGLAMGRAHYGTKRGVQSLSPGLDRESRECLSCHDGSTASTSGVREHGSAGMAAASSFQRVRSMHPIGVRYEWSPKGSMAPQFHPKQQLPQMVRLFNDKVGCGSCHSVYSQEDQMLAQDPKKGRLCLSCHIK